MITYRISLALCLAAPMTGLAFAMVGGAPPADPAIARHVVLLVGSRGNSCSGVAIARDLVLTAAHCVPPGADYKLVIFDAAHQPQLNDITTVTRHPQFDLATLLAHRATADVALLKLAAALPPAFETDQRHAVIGVVSWSTGPQLSAGCGGLTGVTPLARYRTWIVDAAAKMGSVL